MEDHSPDDGEEAEEDEDQAGDEHEAEHA